MSGRFTRTQLHWARLEKEAFSIIATVERLYCLAATLAGFDLLTYHNSLIFIFDPLAIHPDLTQSSVRKVLRWSIRLSSYNYTFIHIPGELNIWVDLLSRWIFPHTIRRRISIPPFLHLQDFQWPSLSEIHDCQSSAKMTYFHVVSVKRVFGKWHQTVPSRYPRMLLIFNYVYVSWVIQFLVVTVVETLH